MALTADDRKSLSKKYVEIPDENAAFAQNIVNLDLLIVDFQAKDASFKNLFDGDNVLVGPYHTELEYVAGQLRTEITEQDIQDSANKVTGNFFFPNDINTPTPALGDGVWKELKSYAGNIVNGKNYQETIPTQDDEPAKISPVTALTTSIAADYSQTERQTGTPDVPPPPPFELPADLALLVAAVDVWEDYLNQQKTALQSNSDPQQTAEIAAAIADIDLSLAEIAAWEALPDYDVDGKVDDTGLAILDDEITRRTPQIAARIAEINTRLGDVTQNTDGSIASQSGLYAARYVNLDARINLAEGALTKQAGLELAKRVQNENIGNNDNYLQYLTDNVLIATKMAADGDGTNTITVDDATEFAISDTVFVVSETQTEITGTITNKVGNVLTLDFTVDATFTLGDIARILKEV